MYGTILLILFLSWVLMFGQWSSCFGVDFFFQAYGMGSSLLWSLLKHYYIFLLYWIMVYWRFRCRLTILWYEQISNQWECPSWNGHVRWVFDTMVKLGEVINWTMACDLLMLKVACCFYPNYNFTFDSHLRWELVHNAFQGIYHCFYFCDKNLLHHLVAT